MIKYHKIETLFERDKETHKVIVEKLRNPVISTITKWRVTEKIDGTNIRVYLTGTNKLRFGGRTDAAQIHADLYTYLADTFTVENMAALRKEKDDDVTITLYGEGYGAGIQKGGGLYRPDKAFILFDVLINNQWWLPDDAVTDIACKLGILRVPELGIHTLESIIAVVRNGFSSRISCEPRAAEGIVARPLMPLYDHRYRRVILKLKNHDFAPQDKVAIARGWGDLD